MSKQTHAWCPVRADGSLCVLYMHESRREVAIDLDTNWIASPRPRIVRVTITPLQTKPRRAQRRVR